MSQLGYQHIPAYFVPFGFDVAWAPWILPSPPPTTSTTLSQAISDAQAQKSSPSPSDVVQNLQKRKPGQILVGGKLVNAPTGPNDPHAANVVSLVHAELLKQGGQSVT